MVRLYQTGVCHVQEPTGHSADIWAGRPKQPGNASSGSQSRRGIDPAPQNAAVPRLLPAPQPRLGGLVLLPVRHSAQSKRTLQPQEQVQPQPAPSRQALQQLHAESLPSDTPPAKIGPELLNLPDRTGGECQLAVGHGCKAGVCGGGPFKGPGVQQHPVTSPGSCRPHKCSTPSDLSGTVGNISAHQLAPATAPARASAAPPCSAQKAGRSLPLLVPSPAQDGASLYSSLLQRTPSRQLLRSRGVGFDSAAAVAALEQLFTPMRISPSAASPVPALASPLSPIQPLPAAYEASWHGAAAPVQSSLQHQLITMSTTDEGAPAELLGRSTPLAAGEPPEAPVAARRQQVVTTPGGRVIAVGPTPASEQPSLARSPLAGAGAAGVQPVPEVAAGVPHLPCLPRSQLLHGVDARRLHDI